MPNHTYCANCYAPKDVEDYSEYLCKGCKQVAREAEQYAIAENLDPGATRKAALQSVAPGSMDGKHPAQAFDRIDTRDIEERLSRNVNSSPVVVKTIQN